MHKGVKQAGFTIVELLVVIVVIGILAAITIVSYTGISQKASVATLVSDLDNASKQFKLYQVTGSAYPTSLDTNYCPIPTDTARCLKASPGISYQYFANNTTTPQTFCMTATKSGTQTYKITNDSTPTLGNCLDYGLALNLDATNPDSYPPPFTGTIWNDLSGNDNDGTLNGATFNSTDPKSMVFDGANDYVNNGNGASLNITTAITLGAWVKFNSLNTYPVMIAKRDITSGVASYSIRAYTTGEIELYLGKTGTVALASPAGSVQAGVWYHIVGTYDGTKMRIYKNGVEVAVSASTSGNINITSHSVFIGADAAVSRVLNGSISKARIYNRALTAEEVAILYNS